MSEWTPEAVAEYVEERRQCLLQRRCPDSGEPLHLDHPSSDCPPNRISCGWCCDCFGYDPDRPLEDQAQ